MSENQPAPKRLTEAEADFLRWMDEIDLDELAAKEKKPEPQKKQPGDPA